MAKLREPTWQGTQSPVIRKTCYSTAILVIAMPEVLHSRGVKRGLCREMLLVKCLALALLASSAVGLAAAQGNGVLLRPNPASGELHVVVVRS